MKKKVLIIVGILVLITLSLITSYIDSARVRNSIEPKFTLKIVSNDGNKVTYWGLGYKVIRYPSVSPNEPYKNNRGVKYGSWFMNYILDSEEIKKEKFIIGHTLEDGRVIHFTFDVPYNDSYMSEALSNKEITIDEFINNLNYLDSYNDGGSKIYEYDINKKIYGLDNFFVITCNSIDNIKDIFVARYKENLRGVCSKHINELEGISMTLKDGTLTKTSATVIITDKSNRENIFGESFTIEKYDNGWKELEPKNDMIFNSIGYTVNESGIIELEIKWDYFYGELKNGTYRILKDFSEPGEGSRHYISVEFIIE